MNYRIKMNTIKLNALLGALTTLLIDPIDDQSIILARDDVEKCRNLVTEMLDVITGK